MTDAQREQVLAALWPAGSGAGPAVWAVLDCAREPAVYRALLESRLDVRCLYSGSLPRALEQVAPHLVELSPGNALIHRWLDAGWGRAWGVFIRIDDASNLRHHLRKFLKVQDEGGRRLLFRYYDPRVLGAYLPTCRTDELTQLFGPVQQFLAESPDGATLGRWRLDDRGLVTQPLALQ